MLSTQEVAAFVRQVEASVTTRVVDQQMPIRQILLAVACGGHVLIEDVPGVGKTTMARAFAQVLGLDFRRIQGTPDRLPSEITGSSIWDNRLGEFRFVAGPVFGQFVLFDEINRSPAKTQSALLEAMEEGQVTIDGIAHALPRPFIVLATQNPVELEGTFPLPEAALDRFFVRVHLGYPTSDGEKKLLGEWVPPAWRLDAQADATPLSALGNSTTIFQLRQAIARVHVASDVIEYLYALVAATRTHPDVLLGLSPRAALAIRQAAQAWAAFRGSDHVTPDDIQQVLGPCGAHRMIMHSEADLRRRTSTRVLEEVVAQTPVNGSWTVAGAGTGKRA